MPGRIARSAWKWRQCHREDCPATVAFVNRLALMLANDCLLYETDSILGIRVGATPGIALRGGD